MNGRKAMSLWVLAGSLASGACSPSQPTGLVVRGTLVGHDGTPMPLAHAHIYKPVDLMLAYDPLVSAQTDSSGRFEVATPKTGVFFLRFTGVGHASKEVPIVAEDRLEVELHVRLGAHRYEDDLSGVNVIGDFNAFDANSALEMRERPDGTYDLEVETDSDTLAYQLVDIAADVHQVNGTDSDLFCFDGSGGYTSVLRAEEGKVRIVFDPERLVRSQEPASVVFTQSESRTARLASLYEEQERRMEAWAEAFSESAATGGELSHDWSDAVSDLVRRAETEDDPLIRGALLYYVLQLGLNGAELDSTVAAQALEELPPTSPLWSLSPYAVPFTVATAIHACEGAQESPEDPAGSPSAGLEEYKAFFDEGAVDHPDEDVRASMLMGVVWLAQVAGDQQLGQEYYQRLLDEYGGSAAADWAREYAPERNIQVGKMIPDFSFTSLDDSTTTITRESLLGTTYLIDFWATWCGPCVAELPNLHEAVEIFGDRGFQILSIAFDEDQDNIAEFRQRRWGMPWLHAHVPDAWEDAAIWPFEVFGIPKAILVDANGMIVGTDNEVRGEKLLETLSRLLDDPAGEEA